MMPGSHKAGGFTLIEVLVAFMILIISLSVLFRIFSGGLRNIALSGDYARALLVAEAQLAAAGVSKPLAEGETFGESGEHYRWRLWVERHIPWEDGEHRSGSVLAYRVTVEVDWDQGLRKHQINLSSIRLQKNPVAGGSG
jgi:general secretion pathway protein I